METGAGKIASIPDDMPSGGKMCRRAERMRARSAARITADSCRFAVRASDGTCAAACIAWEGWRHVCGSIAAAGSLRRAAEQSAAAMRPCCPGAPLPVLAVCALSRCARVVTSARSRLPPVTINTTATRPPSAGIASPAGRVAAVGVVRPPCLRCRRCSARPVVALLYVDNSIIIV